MHDFVFFGQPSERANKVLRNFETKYSIQYLPENTKNYDALVILKLWDNDEDCNVFFDAFLGSRIFCETTGAKTTQNHCITFFTYEDLIKFNELDVSVLIPTLCGRETCCTSIILEIQRQFKNVNAARKNLNLHHVTFEIITDKDNKEVTTGFKRNRLINSAFSRHIVFIDDDDAIHPKYVESFQEFFVSDYYDVAQLTGAYYDKGLFIKPVYYSKDNNWENKDECFVRTTQHLNPMKKILAKHIQYENISYAEDRKFSAAFKQYACDNVIKEFDIPKIPLLYHYLDNMKDTRQKAHFHFINDFVFVCFAPHQIV